MFFPLLFSGQQDVATAIPVFTVDPVLSGICTPGQTLTCTTGTATVGAITSTYQWQNGGVDISGATSATYVVQATDELGELITCIVTATNALGSDTATSNALEVVFDFTPLALPSGVTLARASSATRFNASGVMVSEATDVARFDYDPVTLALRGLLVEPQRTNSGWPSLVGPSYWAFSGAINSGYAAINSPDGTLNATIVTEDTSTGSHRVFFANTYSVVSGDTYTHHAYMKAGTEYIVQLTFQAAFFGGAYANFDLSNGTITASGGLSGSEAKIQNVGNGWYKCSITASCYANGGNTLAMRMTNNNPNAIYSPASYTGTSKYFYAWSAQAEAGVGSTSLIPTTTVAVTRSADVVQFTIPSGVATLRYTFDDNSTQDVAVSAGAYTVPTYLNRAHIKRIQSV